MNSKTKLKAFRKVIAQTAQRNYEEQEQEKFVLTSRVEMAMKKKRFCCWCGKIEDTKLCQSASLRKCTEALARDLGFLDYKR